MGRGSEGYWLHDGRKENAEIADYSQNTQKQADMCHLRPLGYDTMSACDFKKIKLIGRESWRS